MTLQERAKLGGAVAAQRAAMRAETFRRLMEEGLGFKRAAWKAGVSIRTARRYRRERMR
jgi:hypothetical protein